MTKKQIVFIHGGMTFKNKKDYLDYLKNKDIKLHKPERWHGKFLDKKLGKNFDIIRPRMPLADNAKYEEWKINFERYIPFLKNGVILIGYSLGAIFLAKYLSENKFFKRIKAVFLVAPPFDNSLPGEDLVGGFKLKSDLSLIMKNCKEINLFFSTTDDCVPMEHAYKYKQKLPEANFEICKHIKGHFKVSELPKMVKMIKQ